jgi:hypothetical protein
MRANQKNCVIETSPICFSQIQNRYDVEIKQDQKVFHWTDSSELWDWDNCSVTAFKVSENQTRVVIRSNTMYIANIEKN